MADPKLHQSDISPSMGAQSADLDKRFVSTTALAEMPIVEVPARSGGLGRDLQRRSARQNIGAEPTESRPPPRPGRPCWNELPAVRTSGKASAPAWIDSQKAPPKQTQACAGASVLTPGSHQAPRYAFGATRTNQNRSKPYKRPTTPTRPPSTHGGPPSHPGGQPRPAPATRARSWPHDTVACGPRTYGYLEERRRGIIEGTQGRQRPQVLEKRRLTFGQNRPHTARTWTKTSNIGQRPYGLKGGLPQHPTNERVKRQGERGRRAPLGLGAMVGAGAAHFRQI